MTAPRTPLTGFRVPSNGTITIAPRTDPATKTTPATGCHDRRGVTGLTNGQEPTRVEWAFEDGTTATIPLAAFDDRAGAPSVAALREQETVRNTSIRRQWTIVQEGCIDCDTPDR